MKPTILVFSLFLLALTDAMPVQAQGKYENALSKGLELMKTAETAEAMLAAANHFQRIAEAEDGEWIPAYYDAYCRINASFMVQEPEKAGALLDVAQAAIETASGRDGDASELAVLQGMLYHGRIQVDPPSSMTLGPKAAMVLREAMENGPSNPRAALILGENLLFTPEAYGGGSASACPLFKKASGMYAKENAPATEWPAWGAERATANLSKCQGN